jgi:hypothetical protein
MKKNNSTAIATISTPSFEDFKKLISEGNLNKIKILIDANPDLLDKFDKEGKTPLHYAAENCDIDLVKWMIEEKKVNINQFDSRGRTALYLAT